MTVTHCETFDEVPFNLSRFHMHSAETYGDSLFFHRASHTAHIIATLKMAAFLAGHLKRDNISRFCCSKAFKRNHDNSSRLRSCCFGTRPSPYAENDHFEAEIAPLPSICCRVAKKRTG